jgi:hypothetical protein
MHKDQWKAVAVMLGLLGIVGSAEWFVTYCSFSDYCPAVVAFMDESVLF